ncbi:HPF/RaiA family ribosome-associated protein [Pelagicoccus sp. SDUM812003]|uniref:HPF/RaiA family ribosome-associated protein n=1 Tax=Pelagicoccus sp. SDUM812003 TaxID=3041267 RepID=UPI00280C550B|nr:HPF/RaiA family ribosome-associated protein [Pelagicoccus sp. SDUM812003]MDQ8204742.1 HPF/RaiA family ribosome-associated protein [Pelagicoccus sp. SDUM812003]
MKIQVNTGHNIDGRETMAEHITSVVESTLGHLTEHVTRVEVHLSDENSEKGGQDKRCLMEARLERHRPIAVSDEAETSHQAIAGAAEKLKKAIGHLIDRSHQH